MQTFHSFFGANDNSVIYFRNFPNFKNSSFLKKKNITLKENSDEQKNKWIVRKCGGNALHLKLPLMNYPAEARFRDEWITF
jgi:hypothetical protein